MFSFTRSSIWLEDKTRQLYLETVKSFKQLLGMKKETKNLATNDIIRYNIRMDLLKLN